MPRVVHFEIHASDPEKTAQFYQDVFGWQIKSWGNPDMPYWLVTTGEGGAGIDGGLVMRRGPPPTEGQAVNAYVCTIDVPHLDESVQRAIDNGATIAVPRMPVPSVGWLAYVKDPAGNLIGLMQSDPKAK